MAVYKVPQDVEAEDKLIGPFSFKQFIYLIIATLAIGLGYGLSTVLLPLFVIPLPIALFFIVLALPLRKDQPMEIYLAAVVSFLTRPRVRLWRPDGIESLVEVVAPKVTEQYLGKGFSQSEVQKRLSYLADIVDSEGWSVRGVNNPNSLVPSSILKEDLYHEAQALNDNLDESGDRSRKINDLLDKKDNERRQQLINSLQHPQATTQPQQNLVPTDLNAQIAQVAQPVAVVPPTTTISYDIPDYSPSDPYTNLVSPLYTPMSAIQSNHPDEDLRLVVNPYPAINQTVISPIAEQNTAPSGLNQVNTAGVYAQQTVQPSLNQTQSLATSTEPISPAIIDLANNHGGLSIATLQREASRIKQKELMLKENEEVIISLR